MTTVRTESAEAGQQSRMLKKFEIPVPDVRKELLHQRFARESGFRTPLDPDFERILKNLMKVSDPYPETKLAIEQKHDSEVDASPASIVNVLRERPMIHILQLQFVLVRMHENHLHSCLALVQSNSANLAVELVAAFRVRGEWDMRILDKHNQIPRRFREPCLITPFRGRQLSPIGGTKLVS